MKLLVIFLILHFCCGQEVVVSDARYPNKTRTIRSSRGHRRNEACDMLIAIDEPLYKTYNQDLKNLTHMVQLYVKQLNEIYHR